MSRGSAPSWLATQLGHVYTLHFWPPYGDPEGQHAGHYTGSSDKLPGASLTTLLGRGARLTQVQRERGGSWVVGRRGAGRARPGTAAQGPAQPARCSVCHSLRDVETGRITKEEALAKSGWDRASEYERGLLLEIFGMEKQPERIPELFPEAFRARAISRTCTEIDPELDAVVDALVARWTSPKAEAFADAPGLEAEAG